MEIMEKIRENEAKKLRHKGKQFGHGNKKESKP